MAYQGQPGGLCQAMMTQERSDALQFPQRSKPVAMRDPCAVASDHPNSHDLMIR
jgi:hypothetical protein